MTPSLLPAPSRRRSVARPAPRLLAVAVLALAASGCSLLGGGGSRERSTIYAPDPRGAVEASAPRVDWQLTLAPPVAARAIDSFRIAVRPTPTELQVYRGAGWAKTPTDMLQDALLRALEDSGKIGAVARQGSGAGADYKLAIDLRRFEADYAGGSTPAATIEFHAKLIHVRDQAIVASHTFRHAEPAAGKEIALVVDAFSRSLEASSSALAHWILASGDVHWRARQP